MTEYVGFDVSKEETALIEKTDASPNKILVIWPFKFDIRPLANMNGA